MWSPSAGQRFLPLANWIFGRHPKAISSKPSTILVLALSMCMLNVWTALAPAGAQDRALEFMVDDAPLSDSSAPTQIEQPSPSSEVWVDAEGQLRDSQGATLAATSAATSSVAEQNVVFPLDNVGKGAVEFDRPDLLTGSYAFTIPIELPDGTNGFTPQLSISYSSDGPRDGLLGVGFSLSAEDCIERRGPASQDAAGNPLFTRGVPTFTAQDTFFHASQRLVKCDDQPNGATPSCPAGTYRHAVNDFAKIEKLSGGFKIWNKDGTLHEYGLMVRGSAATANFDAATHYCLTRSAKGLNEIKYTWVLEGRPLPRAIYYGGLDGVNFRRSVVFEYEDRPTAEHRLVYDRGGDGSNVVQILRRLKSISVSVLFPTPGYARIRKYSINYQPALSPASGRSRVADITECGQNDAFCLPPYVFTYQDPGNPGWSGTDWTQGGTEGLSAANAFTDFDFNRGYAGIPQQFSLGSFMLDANGNGTSDLIVSENTAPPSGSLNNGDAAWSGDSGLASIFAGVPRFTGRQGAVSYDNGVRVFDINGDGYQDIVKAAHMSWDSTFPAQHIVMLYDPSLNGGSGGYSQSLGESYRASLEAAHIWFNTYTDIWPGCMPFTALEPGTLTSDVNGDGLIDIIVSRQGSHEPADPMNDPDQGRFNTRNEVWLNNGSGFTRASAGYYGSFPVQISKFLWCSPSANQGVRLADVNGDGLPDVVQMLKDAFEGEALAVEYRRVWLNYGNGWSTTPYNISYPTSIHGLFSIIGRGSGSAGPIYVNKNWGTQMADVNGDGFDDFVQGKCTWQPPEFGGTDCSVWNTFLGKANLTYALDNAWKLPTILTYITGGDEELAPAYKDMGVRLVDSNDDGLTDVVANRIESGIDYAFNKRNQFRFDRDKIIAVKNRFGGVTSIIYGKASKLLNPRLAVPRVVVQSITNHNGRSGGEANAEVSRAKSFSYFGGRLDKATRGFAGFRAVVAGDSLDGTTTYTTTWFHNTEGDFCRQGVEAERIVSAATCAPGSAGCYIASSEQGFVSQVDPASIAANQVLKRSVTQYAACAQNRSGPFFVAPSAASEFSYDPANPTLVLSSKQTYVYDPFGNLNVTEFFHDASDSASYIANWAYFASPQSSSAWIYDRVCQKGQISFDTRNHAVQAEYTYFDNLTTFCKVAGDGLPTTRERAGFDYDMGIATLNFTERMEYTPFGNLKKVTDARGYVHETDWNSYYPEIAPAAVSIQPDPDGPLHVTTYNYDQSYGYLMSITRPNAVQEQFAYDTLGRLDQSWKQAPSGAKAEHKWFAYSNFMGNPNLQFVRVSHQLGTTEGYDLIETSYLDGFGHSYLKVSQDRDYLLTTTLNDALGRTKFVSMPHVGSNGFTFGLDYPSTRTEYDELGRVINVSVPGNYSTQFSFGLWRDEGGTVRSVQTVSSSDQTGDWRKKHYVYNSEGHLVALAECIALPCDTPGAGANAQITRYTYDAAWNQTGVLMPDGVSRIRRFFDGFGRLTALKDPNLSNCHDPNVDNPASGCPIRYRYDAAGNLTQVESPEYAQNQWLGSVVSMSYDGLSRLTHKSALKGYQFALATYEQDKDNCGATARARGAVSSELSASASLPPPLPNLAELAQMQLNDEFLQVASENTTKSYCYDEFGRPSAKTVQINVGAETSQAQLFQYGYTHDSKLKSLTLPDGEILTTGFDELNRPYSLSSSLHGAIVSEVLYDQEGQRSSVVTGNGERTSLIYNRGNYNTPYGDRRLNQILVEDIATGGIPYAKQYSYDVFGNVRFTYDWDFVTPDMEEFRYDALNRLQNYLVDGSQTQLVAYDALGNHTRMDTSPLPPVLQRPAAPPASTDVVSDPISRIVPAPQCGVSQRSPELRRLTQKIRKLKARIKQHRTRRLTGKLRALRMRRDELRLREQRNCVPTAQFASNLALSRESLTSVPQTLHYKYGSAFGGVAGPHALICVGTNSVDPCSGALQTFEYDGQGNLLNFSNSLAGFESESYDYTLDNKLSKVTRQSDGQVTQFFYGSRGEKVASKHNGIVTFYLDDSYEIAAGVATRYYVFDGKRIALRSGAAGLKYQIVDHLGSVRCVTDQDGMIMEIKNYYPFGRLLASLGDPSTQDGFGGKTEYASGVYDFGARFYHPALQRFLSPDTVTPGDFNSQGLNSYSFVMNDPVNLVDPSGHTPMWALVELDQLMKKAAQNASSAVSKWGSSEQSTGQNPQTRYSLPPGSLVIPPRSDGSPDTIVITVGQPEEGRMNSGGQFEAAENTGHRYVPLYANGEYIGHQFFSEDSGDEGGWADPLEWPEKLLDFLPVAGGAKKAGQEVVKKTALDKAGEKAAKAAAEAALKPGLGKELAGDAASLASRAIGQMNSEGQRRMTAVMLGGSLLALAAQNSGNVGAGAERGGTALGNFVAAAPDATNRAPRSLPSSAQQPKVYLQSSR